MKNITCKMVYSRFNMTRLTLVQTNLINGQAYRVLLTMYRPNLFVCLFNDIILLNILFYLTNKFLFSKTVGTGYFTEIEQFIQFQQSSVKILFKLSHYLYDQLLQQTWMISKLKQDFQKSLTQLNISLCCRESLET